MRKFGRLTTAASAAVVLSLLVAGCGDDDETSTEETEDTEEVSDYCELAVELDEQDDFPSVEQLAALEDAAPDEIADEIAVVVAAFTAATEAGTPGNAFSDPAVEEAFGPIEAYEEEECGLEGDDEEPQDPSVQEADPSAAQVAVTATEYAFELGSAPVAGRTTFTMNNAGKEAHLMYILQVEEGSTFDEVFAAEGEEGVAADYESKAAVGGESAVITADLVPGEYGMICYLPDPEGTAHVELGMVTQFTVA